MVYYLRNWTGSWTSTKNKKTGNIYFLLPQDLTKIRNEKTDFSAEAYVINSDGNMNKMYLDCQFICDTLSMKSRNTDYVYTCYDVDLNSNELNGHYLSYEPFEFGIFSITF